MLSNVCIYNALNAFIHTQIDKSHCIFIQIYRYTRCHSNSLINKYLINQLTIINENESTNALAFVRQKPETESDSNTFASGNFHPQNYVALMTLYCSLVRSVCWNIALLPGLRAVHTFNPEEVFAVLLP